jgi:H+/Na+-translocating ferredoxin:NAD+ oxidoreductase subunit D
MASEQLYTVGPGPHDRSKVSITHMNLAFIMALVPAALVGAAAHGLLTNEVQAIGRATGLQYYINILISEIGIYPGLMVFSGALSVLCVGAALGLLTEYAIQVAFRQPYEAMNGHGGLMGLLIAMLMPPSVPIWVLVVGVVVTILIGKQIFGGIGSYPMHPAMVGWLVLLLSYSNYIYPVGMQSIAAVHPAVIMVTFVGGLGLVALGHVRWQIPLGVILGVIVSAAFFGFVSEGSVQNPLIELTTGHVILAAFFIATDTTSSPTNRLPMFIFGVVLGVLIMLIRAYGVWPDAVPFAVLLANVLNPLIDRIRPKTLEVVVQNG